jgi:hypothetical protein
VSTGPRALDEMDAKTARPEWEVKMNGAIAANWPMILPGGENDRRQGTEKAVARRRWRMPLERAKYWSPYIPGKNLAFGPGKIMPPGISDLR